MAFTPICLYSGDCPLKTALIVHKFYSAALLPLMALLWFGLLALFISSDYREFNRQVSQRLNDALYASPYSLGFSAFTLRAATLPTGAELSLFSRQGKLLRTTTPALTAPSYTPLLDRLRSIKQDSSCTSDLPELGKNGFLACYQQTTDGDTWLVSISRPALLNLWLQEHGLKLAMCLLGFIGVLLIYLYKHVGSHKSQQQNMALHHLMRKNDNDYQRLIGNLPGLVYRMRVDDRHIYYASPGTLPLTGYSPEAFIRGEIRALDLIHRSDRKIFLRHARDAHHSLREFELSYRIITAHGETKWVLDKGRSYRENQHLMIEGMVLDITERELVRQQIEFLATQDPLTELFNRYKFNDELVHIVDAAKSHHECFAMLFIDLDRFKNINDSLGHQVGDRLLRKVATRLQENLPNRHFIARLGGDEFVVLLRNVSGLNEIHQLAREINRLLRKPFNIDSYQLRTSCSIGIAIFPEHSQQSQVLWRFADTAMYQAKLTGGDSYQFFTPEIGQQVQQRTEIEQDLTQALDNNQFALFFQPQIDLQQNKVIGAEALIRWIHPHKGIISPAQFIPIAEETGLINRLGDWILHEALIHLQKWQAIDEHFTLAVNISPKQVTEELPEKIRLKMAEFNIHPESLELEITESLLMENINLIKSLLGDIRSMHIGFALDDFGTGYSSLSYLRHLPIQKLKIDRAFVKNLENNADDVALVNAIIAMANSLNLKVLAEGIETEGQLAILQNQGCNLYQGYLFGKPVCAEDFQRDYLNTQQIR